MTHKQRRLGLDGAMGVRLACLRIEREVHQGWVAECLGVERPLVSKIEHGQRSLHAAEIPDYARALGMSPQELFSELSDAMLEYDGELRG